MIINFKHLKDVKINYLKHLRFTWFESIRGIIIMIGLIIHGVFPFILPNMFSSYIEGATKRIKTIGT
jgi:hypothetical protein